MSPLSDATFALAEALRPAGAVGYPAGSRAAEAHLAALTLSDADVDSAAGRRALGAVFALERGLTLMGAADALSALADVEDRTAEREARAAEREARWRAVEGSGAPRSAGGRD